MNNVHHEHKRIKMGMKPTGFGKWLKIDMIESPNTETDICYGNEVVRTIKAAVKKEFKKIVRSKERAKLKERTYREICEV